MSLASIAVFARFQRSAASLGVALTAFLYSITASGNFPFWTYSSPRWVCFATSSSGELEQAVRKAANRQRQPNRPVLRGIHIPSRVFFTRRNGGVIIAILPPKRSENNSRKTFVFIYEMVSGSFPFLQKWYHYGNMLGPGGPGIQPC